MLTKRITSSCKRSHCETGLSSIPGFLKYSNSSFFYDFLSKYVPFSIQDNASQSYIVRLHKIIITVIKSLKWNVTTESLRNDDSLQVEI